jgi:hypothetical protein
MQSALGELVTSKDFLDSIHLTAFAITVEQACNPQMLEKSLVVCLMIASGSMLLTAL